MLGSYWDNGKDIRVMLGLCWDSGKMEKNMETTI